LTGYLHTACSVALGRLSRSREGGVVHLYVAEPHRIGEERLTRLVLAVHHVQCGEVFGADTVFRLTGTHGKTDIGLERLEGVGGPLAVDPVRSTGVVAQIVELGLVLLYLCAVRTPGQPAPAELIV